MPGLTFKPRCTHDGVSSWVGGWPTFAAPPKRLAPSFRVLCERVGTMLPTCCNRLTQKTYPNTTNVEYVYDLVGKLQQVSDPTGTYGFAYDNMG